MKPKEYIDKEKGLLDKIEYLATKVVKSDKKLKESEERYKSIVENSHDSIFIIDDQYRMVYVNPQAVKVSGYSEEELLGKGTDVFLTEEYKKLGKLYYALRQRGDSVPDSYEIDVMSKHNGVIRCEVKATTYVDSKGKVNSVLLISDITERKKIETDLKNRETLFRSIYDISPFAVFVYGCKEEKIIYHNRALLEITKYEKDELKNNYVTSIMSLSSFIRIKGYLTEIGTSPVIDLDINTRCDEIVNCKGVFSKIAFSCDTLVSCILWNIDLLKQC